MLDGVVQHGLWAAVTRLGEAQILLPAFIGGTLWLAFVPAAPRRADGGSGGRDDDIRRRGPDHGDGQEGRDGREAKPPRDSARAWGAGIIAATGITTASKVAFLGFGIGSIALDFTGLSGHAMYSMAILPVLAALVAGQRGAAVGVLLAIAVLVSRVELHAHSWSEALSGALLGGVVAGWTLGRYFRRPAAVRAPWWLPLGLVAWLTLLPWRAPPSRTHDLVVSMSLWLSDRTEPYTRHELLAGKIRRTQWQ